LQLGQSSTPAGMRLYAVGDVHGCDSMLAGAHAKIAKDLADRPVADHRIVHVGDYCDRGPDSAGVVERLAALTAGDPRVICLRGNHDQMLIDFLGDPATGGEMFLFNGGEATLASYGVPARFGPRRGYAALARALGEAMPAHHRAFFDGLALTARFGDYLFVHAGIRPGVPLDKQHPEDLVWIREEFLWDDRDHGFVVIHGHTPSDTDKVRPNRINIDTGAVYGGTLTCLRLEGTDYRFL